MSENDDREEEFEEHISTILQVVQTPLRTGFASEEHLINVAAEEAEMEFGDGDWKPKVVPIVQAAIQEHKQNQNGWEELTDCDRLDSALFELGKSNILARHNYWCCSTCGTSAIDSEVHDHITKFGRRIQGYVYYHAQDTEAAVDHAQLCLRFGGSNYSDKQSIEVAKLIIKALEDEKLNVTWSGRPSQSIVVSINWKRRQKPRLYFPFLQSAHDPEAGAAGEHYVSLAAEEPKKDLNVSEQDRAQIQEWVPIVIEHFQAAEPSTIKIAPEKIALMRKIFRLKSQISDAEKRPVSDQEIGDAVGVHRLVVSSVDQLFRYHISEL